MWSYSIFEDGIFHRQCLVGEGRRDSVFSSRNQEHVELSLYKEAEMQLLYRRFSFLKLQSSNSLETRSTYPKAVKSFPTAKEK